MNVSHKRRKLKTLSKHICALLLDELTDMIKEELFKEKRIRGSTLRPSDLQDQCAPYMSCDEEPSAMSDPLTTFLVDKQLSQPIKIEQPTTTISIQEQLIPTMKIEPSTSTCTEKQFCLIKTEQTNTAIDESSIEELSSTIKDEHCTTAIYIQEEDHSESSNESTSSSSTSRQIDSLTTKNKKVACLFCDNVEQKIGQKRNYVTFPRSDGTVETIKAIAQEYSDWSLLEKLGSNRTIAYHSNCLSLYRLSTNRQNKGTSYIHKSEQIHQLAFNAISVIIEAEIIEKNSKMYLSDLFSRYKSSLLKYTEGQVIVEDINEYSLEKLESEILKTFGDKVTVGYSLEMPRQKVVYHYKGTSPLVGEIAMEESSREKRFRDVAYELRNCVTSGNIKLPDNITSEDVIREERDIPGELFNFLNNLVQGPDTRNKILSDDLLKVKSLCNDFTDIIKRYS